MSEWVHPPTQCCSANIYKMCAQVLDTHSYILSYHTTQHNTAVAPLADCIYTHTTKMLAQATSRTVARPCSTPRSKLVIRCSGNGTSSGAFGEGQRVKVAVPVKVYHAPKHPEGLDLHGMEGTVVKDVTQYKGKVLSANFPLFVEFALPAGDKPSKFKVHLVRAARLSCMGVGRLLLCDPEL